MTQFVVRLRTALESTGMAAGTEVARFDTQGEAEYFMSLAVKLRALRECDLVVARVDAGAVMELRPGGARRRSPIAPNTRD